MSIADHFEAFLVSTVDLQKWRLDQLTSRVESIVNALNYNEDVEAAYKEHIPQGSWAHRTIIRPVTQYDEFDADFLLHLSEDNDWASEPRDYLKKVRSALKANATYKDKVRKKNRCVRVGYANDCHVDIVPHLTLTDGRQVIVNYKENQYEETNPDGFTQWMRERDALTNENLRSVIRLLKYIRDFKNTFSCPSVILTTLVGGRIQSFDTATRYSDVSTTLTTLLCDLSAWLNLYSSMPLIDDPSCPGTSFNHRWDEDKYQNFKAKVELYAGWAQEASETEDEEDAIAKWQKLFGPEFAARAVTETKAAIALSHTREGLTKEATATERAPGEEFIENRGLGFNPRYSARVEGRVEELGGFRSRPIRSRRSIPRGSQLKFKLITDTPGPFQIIWKVRNFGTEATQADDLRGKLIFGEPGSLLHRESARYGGDHYIEAYVVKNGIVVASDHHEVRIR